MTEKPAYLGEFAAKKIYQTQVPIPDTKDKSYLSPTEVMWLIKLLPKLGIEQIYRAEGDFICRSRIISALKRQ